MAKLLMMSELSGDVLTHRSRRCFSVYSLSSLQHGDLKMNEAEVLAKKYSVDDHQNEDSDLGSNSSMESSRPVQHNTVRGLVLLAALAVLVAVVFAFPQREENDSGCDDDKSCNSNNLCVNPCFYKCMDVGCEVKKHVAKCIYDGHLFWEPYVQATTPPAEGSTSELHVQPTSPENEESSPQRK
ncbi:Protein of unknown function [Gryllus bimaculatus]|nr:Protein of unknown function [Gryllus bimaculatus]